MTLWPTATFTAVTFPDTAKFEVAWLVGSMVPDADTVCFMVPVSRTPLGYGGEAAARPRVPDQIPTPAAARTMRYCSNHPIALSMGPRCQLEVFAFGDRWHLVSVVVHPRRLVNRSAFASTMFTGMFDR